MEHSLYTLENKTKLKLVQITDTHLYGHPNETLLGLNTRESFQCVLDLVKANQPHPDAIIITGDISQDLSLESYQYLHEHLQPFNCPKFLFEGNHDHPDYIEKRSEEHTSELQSRPHLVCRLLLEKKKKTQQK